MTTDKSKWEEDEDWLLDRMPMATENQLEFFCERVSVAKSEGKMTDDQARLLAKNLLVEAIKRGEV